MFESDQKRRRLSAMTFPVAGTGVSADRLSTTEEVEPVEMCEGVQKVLATWESKQAAFDEQILWEGKIKARSFNGLSKALEDAANKIIGDDSEYLQGIAKDMLDFTEKARAKFDLFAKLKKQVRQNVEALSDEELKILKTLRNGRSLIPKIMMHCCSSLLKEIEDTGVGVSVW